MKSRPDDQSDVGSWPVSRRTALRWSAAYLGGALTIRPLSAWADDWEASGATNADADGATGGGDGRATGRAAERAAAKAAESEMGQAVADLPDGWRLGYDRPQVQRWRFGLRLDTNRVVCKQVLATFPVPMAWPEQTVRLVSQVLAPQVKTWNVRQLAEGVRQIVVTMPRVLASASPEVTFDFEVTRSRILPPERTDDLRIPRRADSTLKNYLGTSPYIDSNDGQIRRLSRALAAETHDQDWQRVEAAYDWVRENIDYVEGTLKSASQAMKDGFGDCEEMTSLFIALCRNQKIPARMVWIPGHCYAEFYLQDEAGNGTWFPCQLAGTRQFGTMDEPRPVLQKGDRFRVPEKMETIRYVTEFFSCVPSGRRDPLPAFVQEQIATS